MRRISQIHLWFVAAVLGAGAGIPGIGLSAGDRGLFPKIELGLCEDYPEESRSLEAARRDLEFLNANGIRLLRIAFGWDAIQPERDTWDWSFWDGFVRMAADEYGIRLIPYVCYTPQWASSQKGEDDFWRAPPLDHGDFARFLRRLVSRYRDRIQSWELWNEPDNPAYWTGSVEQFASLVQAGARAVRDVDPGAKVVLGGLAWDLRFLETILADAAMEQVDVVNLHNYSETWSSDPIERLPEYVGRAWDLIRLARWPGEIWMAELGYSSYRQGPLVSEQFRAFYGHEHTARHQAVTLFRMLSLLLATEQVSLIAWYRIHDLPETQAVIGDVNNRHLGVLDREGNAKPALHALRFFQRLFREGVQCVDREVRVEKGIGAPVEVHAFRRPDGSVVVIAWMQTCVPGDRGGDGSGSVRDVRQERISLVFPWRLQPEGSRFNELGESQPAMSLAATRDGLRVDHLEVEPERVTVFILEPPEPD